MQVLRLSRQDGEFYEYLGPVFGSRVVEQETRDRFYDDPGKVWYCVPGQGATSVLEDTIKNFWAANALTAEALLQEIQADFSRLRGIVPRVYEPVFRRAGFSASAYRKNFMEVRYAKEARN